MSEDQKRILEKQLWGVANVLRGKMNADEYKNYILGFIFYKYLSEKLELYVDSKLLANDNFIFAEIKASTNEGKKALGSIKASCVDYLGFFLKPSELFSYLVKKGKGEVEGQTTFILEDLKNVLNTIEQTSMGTASEDDFRGLFDDMDLTSSKLGSRESQKNEVVVEVLKLLDGIDFKLEDTKSDLLGDAYEYLIGEFAAGAGKKGGEFYTPAQVSRLLAQIVSQDKKRIRSVFDPTCGSGSLLLRIKDYVDVADYYGQELNPTTYNLARMNMILHGVRFDHFTIRQGDTLTDDMHADLKAEAVVANPPFSAQWKGESDIDLVHDDRFSQYGRLAPKSAADYAFVTHMLYHLADNGTMAIVLPHGALFRSGAEGQIRKYIIEKQNYLDAVIGLPSNLFYGTSIPATVLVFKKCRRDDEDILFIDASKEFEKGKNQNKLTDENIAKIFDTYKNRAEIEKYSHRASTEEIKENEYNLNIPRYVDTFEEEEVIDIEIVSENLDKLANLEKKTSLRIANYCNELVLPKPEGNNLPLLKEYKKGIMQKIFSQEIRFKDNNGNNFPEWEEKKLEDIAEFKKGRGISKDDLVDGGKIRCILYGELYTKYNEVIREVRSRTNILEEDSLLSQIDDVLIPSSGETALDIATVSCIKEENVLLGGDLNVIRLKEQDGIFFAYYLANFQNRNIARLAQGNSVVHLYNSHLKTLKLNIPSLIEQRKIANFLDSIDNLINLKQQQVIQSENWKKGLMQGLFV